MSKFRFKALEKMFDRVPVSIQAPGAKTSDYFAQNVFDKEKMRKYLSEDAYEHILECIDAGTKVDRKTADQIASGMKAWAMERGCTHYTHWFNPLTDGTAEKHDAFIDFKDGKVFEVFSGSQLSQAEPDASSFPNGGSRQTFEARGYTAWDASSPAFILNNTLCIPTIFLSYTGESLDHKTPLLKSLQALDRAATEVCQYFDKNVKKATAYLGAEQEYFLVDQALYLARPDLVMSDRTLMGHASAKNQQLEDHYFSAIPLRVSNFMKDLEFEAYLLGIPLKTRHNEVAPNQFECAPIFEELNLAVDHNQVLMDVMKNVAIRHNFRAIFHEKPFKGVNGTGKHNNWSVITDTGVNLLKPGKNPKSNLQFLTFLINTIVGVYDHQDLLCASILSAANEHRLGANEAPPVIISVFLGREVSAMLDEIESNVSDKVMTPDEKTSLKLDIGKIPEVLLDNTDRNRTSPFAFTGNRFEFRAVGGSANCSSAMIAVNSLLADQLAKFKVEVDGLIDSGIKKDEAILKVLRRLITYSKPIRFDGDGYSQAWVEEAERRGLSNVKSTPEALKAYISAPVIKMFADVGVMNENELHVRYEVRNETYKNKLQIEGRVLGDLAINHIIPTAIRYQSILIDNVKGLKEILPDEFELLAANEINTIREIAEHSENIRVKVEKMRQERSHANSLATGPEQAAAYFEKVKPCLADIRRHIDALELIVDDELWPLPKYRELLFNR